MRSSCAIAIHFLISRRSVIRNNFLEFEGRPNRATHFARRNEFYALLAINKAKHILSRLFSCSCSDTIYIGFFNAPVVTQFIVRV